MLRAATATVLRSGWLRNVESLTNRKVEIDASIDLAQETCNLLD